MNLKKRLKAFFTLKRRANDGFTLVELIVVIAIMAILAGVGTVGYSGYIKSSNKNADKVLVGNIMRAIETGTNSYAFVSNDSFKMGSFTYPVGIVSLSSEGTKIITSSTEQYPPTEGQCEWETIDNVCTLAANGQYVCLRHVWETFYTASYAPITYCKTHSSAPQIEQLSGQYVSGWNHDDGALGCALGCKKFEYTYATYSAGSVNINNKSALYVPSTNPSMCEAAYANQYGVFKDPEIGEAETGDPLHDSLVAAFGNDFSALKLSYDGWTSEEGVGFSTFYISAPTVMDKVAGITGPLVFFSQTFPTVAAQFGLSNYESENELMAAIPNNIVTQLDEKAWDDAWNAAANSSWEDPEFFGGLTGLENYATARMFYNAGFASYVKEMDPTITDDQIKLLNDFNKGGVQGTDLVMPALINTKAFTDDSSGLKAAFAEKGDPNAGQEGSAFNRVAALYEQYKNSDICKENGKQVYGVLTTIKDTTDVAQTYVDLNGGKLLDYYSTYIKEMSGLYNAALEQADGGIVIIVSVENGKLSFQVSPAAANPRA